MVVKKNHEARYGSAVTATHFFPSSNTDNPPIAVHPAVVANASTSVTTPTGIPSFANSPVTMFSSPKVKSAAVSDTVEDSAVLHITKGPNG